jgi:hypothetical protein
MHTGTQQRTRGAARSGGSSERGGRRPAPAPASSGAEPRVGTTTLPGTRCPPSTGPVGRAIQRAAHPKAPPLRAAKQDHACVHACKTHPPASLPYCHAGPHHVPHHALNAPTQNVLTQQAPVPPPNTSRAYYRAPNSRKIQTNPSTHPRPQRRATAKLAPPLRPTAPGVTR